MASPSIVASSSAKIRTKPSSCFPPSSVAHRCRIQSINHRTLPTVRHAMTVKGRRQTVSVKPYAVLDSIKLDAELISRSTIGHGKPENLCIASISTSSDKMTTSKGTPPLLAPPYIGSSLLWIGVGVGLSIIFQVFYMQ